MISVILAGVFLIKILAYFLSLSPSLLPNRAGGFTDRPTNKPNNWPSDQVDKQTEIVISSGAELVRRRLFDLT
jgi:hypothetical protein